MSKVNLCIRKNEVKKDGTAPVGISFSVDGKQVRISIGESFPPEKINGNTLEPGKDVKLGEVAKRIRHTVSVVEIEIEKARTASIDVVAHVKKRLAEDAGKEPDTPEAPKIEFLALYDKWVHLSKSRISKQTGKSLAPNTIKTYISAREHFKEFDKKQPIDITSLGKTFYGEFNSFMMARVSESNSFGKYVGILKVFLTWAESFIEENHQVNISTKFMKFEAPKRYIGVDHLTSQELELFKNFKTDKPHLEKANDIFLMLCYTAASIVDYRKVVDEKNIFRKDSKMIYKRGKTGNTCIVPFFDDQVFKPVSLLDKYKLSGRSFPEMVDQNVNEHLKVVQKLVGFHRFQVTTKIGRKTFATIKHIEQGVPSQICMKATGHTTEKSFLRYVGIDHSAVVGHFRDKAQFMKVV